MPKSRVDYWTEKFDKNVARDWEISMKLQHMGWEVLVVWECETKDMWALKPKLISFLDGL